MKFVLQRVRTVGRVFVRIIMLAVLLSWFIPYILGIVPLWVGLMVILLELIISYEALPFIDNRTMLYQVYGWDAVEADDDELEEMLIDANNNIWRYTHE